MPVETPSLFARVIQDHLELKRRNSELEGAMPLNGYRIDDPFDNHPLFKTEEQARLEETMDGEEPAVSVEAAALLWPGEESLEHVTVGVVQRRSRRGYRPLVEVTRLRLGRLAARCRRFCREPEVGDEPRLLALSFLALSYAEDRRRMNRRQSDGRQVGLQ